MKTKASEKKRQETGPACRLQLDDALAPALLVQDGYVSAFNRLARELVGGDDQALAGREFLTLIHPQDQARVETYLSEHRIVAELGPCRLLTAAGEIRWIQLNRCETGWQGVPASLFLLKDVTDAKLAQDEAARMQRLEAASRVAGQIAHDFNNLLSPMAAYPSLIRETLGEHHPAADMLDAIEKGTNSLTEIIQQLLALGRRGHYTPEPVDLNALVHKVVIAECLSPKIEVVEKLQKNMLPVKGSEAQLARVLVNLVRNAAEAMHGSGRLTCSTEHTYLDRPLSGYQTVQRGEYATLRISDTGDGIAPEDIQRIFDPFYTTKRSTKRRGAGLGLSVAYAIVADHDAYISVESHPGQGSTFSIFFPIVREVASGEALPVSGMRGGRESILVVDDDPVQGEVASNLLKHLGYRVDVVADGESAVGQIREEHYDLIVLDMVMGRGIDGAETYRQILEIEPEQPAILWSGHAMSTRVQAALKLGAGSFVSKPVSQSVLAEAVRKELDKKRHPSRGR